MIQNELKIAYRNLKGHKFFTVLNVVGLALGMSACLTVILIIRDQLSYDHFHPSVERLYRINCEQAEGARLASVPQPLGETILRDFSIAESSVSLVRNIQNEDATTSDNLTLPVSGFFAEKSFFDVFGFKLEAGNAATALAEPNTLVLSKKAAKRFFGNQNPVGKTLTLKDKGACSITGVVAEPPGKSHLTFDCLVSLATLIPIEQAFPAKDEQEKSLGNWENRYSSYVYIRLLPGKTESDLSNALAVIAERRKQAGKTDSEVHYFAQNMERITPRPERLANDIGGGAPWFFIWGMGVFVVLLIIFPSLNYANLAIARALERTREMGVRKAIGARAFDVKKLVLAESVLTSMIALALACALHLPLNQFVIKYFPAAAALSDLGAKGIDWLYFALFGLAVGLFAGWLPARRMAQLHTTAALRGSTGQIGKNRRFDWRSVMLIGQFAASLVFMIVVTTLWSQLNFMTVADYGFQKENLVTIDLQGNKAAIVAAEFSQDPRVKGVCMTTVQIAGNNLQGIPLRRERTGEDVGIDCAMVDDQYIPVMGLTLISGENFPKKTGTSGEEMLIVNEKALERFQLGSAKEAIGKILWMNDTTPMTVKGVIRDFHYRIMNYGIEPFALRYAPTENGFLMHARLAPGNPTEAMAAFGSIWKKIDNTHPFKGEFMEESIQKAYDDVTFLGGLASFFALLSLSIACIGLLGTVTHAIGTKVKEIGIRKVVGASTAQITLLLSQRFLILLMIALGLALPVGYWVSNEFLNIFANRIAVGGAILGGCSAVLLILGMLTVGIQTGRAAVLDPVKSLRSE